MTAICHLVFCFLASAVQGDDARLDGALQMLDSPDALVRLRAVTDIGNLASKPKSAVPILFSRLKTEKNGAVRAQMLASIAAISFRDEKKELRPLEQIDDKVLQAIGAYLEDESLEVRKMAMSCLRNGGAKSKFAVPRLLESVIHEDASVRCAAMVCLHAIGPDAAPALPLIRLNLKMALRALKDEDDPERKKYSLGQMMSIQEIAARAIAGIEGKKK